MEFGDLTSLIGTLGFPMVMCLLMYKYMTDVQTRTSATLNKVENALHLLEQSVESLTQAIISKNGE